MTQMPRMPGWASPCNPQTTLRTRRCNLQTRRSGPIQATSNTTKASPPLPRFQSSEVRVPPVVSGQPPTQVRPTISADLFLDYTSTSLCLMFLTRYRMVSDEKYQGMISWNPTGTSFYITRVQEFAATVLPLHYKHSNFSSFVRQLNMYTPRFDGR
jgi:hypothetical protein